MTSPLKLVETASAQGTLNVLEAAKGRAYPDDDVVIYTDAKAAYEAHRLAVLAADQTDSDKADEIGAQEKDARDRVLASALTFHLRGFSRGVIDAINEEARVKFGTEDTGKGDIANWCNLKYVAESIIRVEDAAGGVDEHHWTPEEVRSLYDLLPIESYDKIVNKMFELSFAASLFDTVVDADF
jgi:hypothetical protein